MALASPPVVHAVIMPFDLIYGLSRTYQPKTAQTTPQMAQAIAMCRTRPNVTVPRVDLARQRRRSQPWKLADRWSADFLWTTWL